MKRHKYRNYDHDEGARMAAEQILFKIKNDLNWRNPFLENDLCKAQCKRSKPAPDARFYSSSTNCHVAIEYKPPYSDLDEIGKGFNQCFDYIADEHNGNYLNQASYLVIPRENDLGDKIEDLYKKKFDLTVHGKNPIALITYDPNNPSDIELIVNFSNKFSPPEGLSNEYAKQSLITYWAAWRENYPSLNYRLLKTASEHVDEFSNDSKKQRELIWNNFYTNHYCFPPNTNETLDLLETNLKTWGDDPIIWAKSIKSALKTAVRKGIITNEQAINRLKWASASNREDIFYYGNKIKNIQVQKPEHFDRDNDYQDIKKNRRNFLSHTGLWDNLTWKPTPEGEVFLRQIENGSDPMLEFGSITLFLGRWFELIDDIKKVQKNLSLSVANNTEFKQKLKPIFIEKGFIGLNPGRKTTGSRKFLQSEQQILGRLGILEKNKNTYFFKNHGWKFDEQKIEDYLDHYYNVYDSIDMAA
jgi:hypothetical protein